MAETREKQTADRFKLSRIIHAAFVVSLVTYAIFVHLLLAVSEFPALLGLVLFLLGAGEPEAAGEIRDRALLLAQMQRTEEAIRELTRYLGQRPELDDPEKAREQLRALRMGQALLN